LAQEPADQMPAVSQAQNEDDNDIQADQSPRLSIDKSAYTPGETVRFRITLTEDVPANLYLNGERLLSLLLQTPEGKRIPLSLNFGKGDAPNVVKGWLQLPKGLAAGAYTLNSNLEEGGISVPLQVSGGNGVVPSTEPGS